MQKLSTTGLLRLCQIIGQAEVTVEQAEKNKIRGYGPRRPRPAITPIIPVGKTTWWNGVKSGRFPRPVLGPEGTRITVWRAEDIDAYVKNYCFQIGGKNETR